MMATNITTDITTMPSTMPSTTDTVPCWECSKAVEYEQAVRTATGWGALICEGCEGWVASHLGPLSRSDRYR